jgi:uncharacterized protein YjdB
MKRRMRAAIVLSMALSPLNALPIGAEETEEPIESDEAAADLEEVQEEETVEGRSAAYASDSSLTYEYNSANLTATVTGADKSAASIEIPKTVTYGGKTYTVTAMADSAFEYHTNLTSVVIPDSITEISQTAFNACSSLTSITIPNSVNYIGMSAFSGCSRLTSITIPNSVTIIDNYAFYGCTGLTKIVIPSSVTAINNYVFQGCSSLTSVTIPSSVTQIGYSSFRGCIRLSSITIPDSVKEIDGYAFYGCSSLSKIIIPDSVTSLGGYVFYGCKNLKNVYYSSNLTSVSTETYPPASEAETFQPQTEKLPDSLQKGKTYATEKVLLPINNTNYSLEFGNTPSTIVGWTPVDQLPNYIQTYIKTYGVTYINNAQIILDKDVYLVGDTAIIQSWPLAAIELNGQKLSTTIGIDGTASLTSLKAGPNTVKTTNQYGQTSTVTFTVSTGAVEGVSLDQTNASISVNDSLSLTATVSPSNAANKTVSWKSSDSSVASVDANGKVTAKKVGTATITVTTEDGGYTASCKVSVVPAAVSSVSLDQTNASVNVNGTVTLKATISPSNAADQTIIWNSSNTNVATVSSSGVVTGKAAGSAIISATTTNGKSASCTITVNAIQATGVALNASSLYFESGKTYTLKATILPSNANSSVSWSSSNTKVATVDSNGKVTIKGSGEATITAKTSNGKTASCKVYGYTQQAMHRMYNPNSGEHFYTASTVERDSLVKVGWKYEGVAWTAPSYSDTPVYRLYNPNAGDHHYTTSEAERDALVKAGWKYEGIGWYSDSSKTVALHRLYNPNAIAGAHHYTTSTEEKNMLVKVGWKYENYGWYGLK